MPSNDKNKLNKLEELKNKLFSKSFRGKSERHDTFSYVKKEEVADTWEKEEDKSNMTKKFFMKTPLFKRFLIFSVIFFVLALGYASYMFLAGGNVVSNENIEITVLGNAFTAGGEELSLQVGIINKNGSPLEAVDLVVEYPKSSQDGNASKDVERYRESLGAIPAGVVRNENLKVVLFGEQGSIRRIKISIEYRVEGSNAIFVKEKFYDVSINSSPINLSVDAPTEISPNQDINLKVKTTLNASQTTTDVLMRVDYPVGFQFISAVPSPAFGNNVWDLGDLSPGAEQNVSIVGKMIDVFDGEEKTFRIFSGSQSQEDKANIDIVFNSLGHTVLVKKPFIEAKIFVNGTYEREYASYTKTPIFGEIQWVNNLDTKINDLVIKAKITGNAVNQKTIRTQEGFYNSLDDTITWDKNFQQEFREINPGYSGTVSFSLGTLSSIMGDLLDNPAVNIEVSISGKQSLEGNVIKELHNSEVKTIKIISDVGLTARAQYSIGPFTNTGPIPPKAEKETTYTIVWGLSSTTSNISKAKVHSTFPPWIRFAGFVSPASEDLVYNPTTKEIDWNIGKIIKGSGVETEAREVAFQVVLTPSVSQVGSAPTLVNDMVLTGHDDFANVDVRVTKTLLNTKLTNDPAFTISGDRVVE